MKNEAIDYFEQIVAQYGHNLPPLDFRIKIWPEIIQRADTINKLQEFYDYLGQQGHRVHHQLIGELGRIMSDNPDIKIE